VKAERTKWEAKYRSGDRLHDGPPSGLLRRWLPDLPRGRALDVATGLGRNALYLARAGYRVDAIDVSPTGLREAARRARRLGLRVRWIEADLDTYRLPKARYDVVVNAFFLKRRLLGELKSATRPGGVMIVETHLESPRPDGGPPGARHRLRRGELRRRFRGWDVLDLEEGLFQEGGRAWVLGRIVARRPRTRVPGTRVRVGRRE
jgi:SAM-dependent methyltransferase